MPIMSILDSPFGNWCCFVGADCGHASSLRKLVFIFIYFIDSFIFGMFGGHESLSLHHSVVNRNDFRLVLGVLLQDDEALKIW
jgi:hypothetical protein